MVMGVRFQDSTSKNSFPLLEGASARAATRAVRQNRGPRPLEFWLRCGTGPATTKSQGRGSRKPRPSLSSNDRSDSQARDSVPTASQRVGLSSHHLTNRTVIGEDGMPRLSAHRRDHRSLCPRSAESQPLAWVLRTPSRHS
jgi:hypothetical protein